MALPLVMLIYLNFFLSCPLFLSFFLSFPSFPLISFILSLFLFLFLSFFLSFWSPFGDPGGPGPLKPPKIRPLFSLSTRLLMPLMCFFLEPPNAPQEFNAPACYVSLYPPESDLMRWNGMLVIPQSSRKIQPILQKVESRGRCCLLTFLPYFFDFLLIKHPPMPCR